MCVYVFVCVCVCVCVCVVGGGGGMCVSACRYFNAELCGSALRGSVDGTLLFHGPTCRVRVLSLCGVTSRGALVKVWVW